MPRTSLKRFFPFSRWLLHYRRADLLGDLQAGVIVAIMLVPQSMAYALLAGLPPQVGLYASIVPLVVYGLMGSSRQLAVGPVAIVSIMTAAGIGALAGLGSGEAMSLALLLALLSGLLQLGLGLGRLGFVVNYLSQPVLAGFASAAALIIGFSQLKHLLGFDIPRSHYVHTILLTAAENIRQTNVVTLAIGLGSLVVLLYFKLALPEQLRRRKRFPAAAIVPVSRSGPLAVVVLSTLIVWWGQLDQAAGVKVVGGIPAGLPPLTLPLIDPDNLRRLLPTALAITFVGFTQSISAAKALASRRRQKINANQELVALGLANLAASVTGGYPVTGGFSRSAVNAQAGANTGLASIITATLIALTVLFLTPLFTFLPRAVLAAIIMVAVLSLIDIKRAVHIWRINRVDLVSLLITFGAVLIVGIEAGILVGAAATILLFIWRTSHPHVAKIGRLGDSEIYRNVLRHPVKTCPHVLALRVDESLYFANTRFLEDYIWQRVYDHPEIRHLVLMCTAINFIDASALETMETLISELRDFGIQFYMAAVKGPVMDQLKRAGFVDFVGEEFFYLKLHDLMQVLECV